MASSITRTTGGRIGLVTGFALAATMIVAGAATGSAQPGWERGLHVRSAALNAKYAPSAHALGTLSAIPAWREALTLRSEALNRKYGLGGLTTLTVSHRTTQLHSALALLDTSPTDWQQERELRTLAVDRAKQLGGIATLGASHTTLLDPSATDWQQERELRTIAVDRAHKVG